MLSDAKAAAAMRASVRENNITNFSRRAIRGPQAARQSQNSQFARVEASKTSARVTRTLATGVATVA